MELAEVRLAVADEGTAAALEDAWPAGDGSAAGGHRPVARVALVRRADRRGGRHPARVAGRRRTTSTTSGSAPARPERPRASRSRSAGARAAILGNTWVMSTSAPVAGRGPSRSRRWCTPAAGASSRPCCAAAPTSSSRASTPTRRCGDRVRGHRLDVRRARRCCAGWAPPPSCPLLRDARLGCLMLAGEPAAAAGARGRSASTPTPSSSAGARPEAPASTTFLTREEMRSPALWSSIGRPVPGVEFSLLVDGEVARRPAPGVDGELVIRTPSVASELLGAARGARGPAAGRRLVADLRRRPLRRGGPDLHRRPGQRDDHHRRDEHPAGRDRTRAGGAPRGARGGGRRRPRRAVGGDACGARLRARPGRRTGRGAAAAGSSDRLAGFKRPRHVFVTSSPSRGSRASRRSRAGRSNAPWPSGFRPRRCPTT